MQMIDKYLTKGIITIGVAMLLLSPSGISWARSTLSQGFLSAKPLTAGQLVSLQNNPGIVTAADTSNIDSLTGVVVSAQDSLLALSTKAGEVQVATSGVVDTLLSTIDGDIKVGDRVTASPLAGVGTKAVSSIRVIGVAQGSLDGKTPGAVKTSVKGSDGKNQDIYIGKVPVQLGVTFFSTGSVQRNPVPSFLQKFANSVASKQVQPLPILVSGVIILLTLLAASVILYASIRGSIISIGRNPLAKGGVLRSLIQVTIMVTLLIMASLVTIYFVLRTA